jgi:putative heme iron utilization protein
MSLDDASRHAIVTHMNEDHADAVLLYARVFAGCPEARAARIDVLRPEAMELLADTSEGVTRLTVPFDHVLVDREDAHHTLVAMVREARSVQHGEADATG